MRLKKAPPHATRGGLHWGSWDGALAIVDVYSERFDAARMERCYVVRLALDLHERKPIRLTDRAFERVVGQRVNVRDPSARYEETTFEIGNRVYDPINAISGTFAPIVEYRVKVSLVDMTDEEHRTVLRTLSERHFVRIETRRSARQIRDMINRSFTELQNDYCCEIANEADRILCRDLRFDTGRSTMAGCDAAWSGIGRRGVYVETAKGRIKWILPPAD
ncbi:MAG: hypothetical protein HC882_04970 [Acidobacteria bacterium]|nr:hypothetical protein [Acidobacteriota bacterium]